MKHIFHRSIDVSSSCWSLAATRRHFYRPYGMCVLAAYLTTHITSGHSSGRIVNTALGCMHRRPISTLNRPSMSPRSPLPTRRASVVRELGESPLNLFHMNYIHLCAEQTQIQSQNNFDSLVPTHRFVVIGPAQLHMHNPSL